MKIKIDSLIKKKSTDSHNFYDTKQLVHFNDLFCYDREKPLESKRLCYTVEHYKGQESCKLAKWKQVQRIDE